MAGQTPQPTRRVMSPCIGICMIDPKGSGFCLGCKRTIEEIGRWAMMDDSQRQAVLDQLPGRTF
ncbi:MAG: DUF1289 domain-containing protein [Enhydrobacter sp.]|nr:MAG: DUF1289 domain-containing protein [Enhydrobacter sp.]